MSKVDREKRHVIKLHPRLEGKRVLYIESFGLVNLIEDRLKIEKVQLVYNNSIAFEEGSLLQFMEKNGIHILAIHPEPNDTWKTAIDDVINSKYPVIVIEGSIVAKPGSRELFQYYRKKGIPSVDRADIFSSGYFSYEDSFVDALDTACSQQDLKTR